jgi:hypothetical protein
MKIKCALAITGIGFATAAAPAMAHHSFAAEYDANQPLTLEGAVTRIEWTNPHSHISLDVKDEHGKVITWRLELASPKVLIQCGWTAKSIKVGDEVTVEGARAKDGSTTANARIVRLADGRRVSAGSSGGDTPLSK